jgi:hypothetical protein
VLAHQPPAGQPAKHHDIFGPARPDRLHEPAADCQLPYQRGRHARMRGGDHDAVIGRVLRQPLGAVADDDGGVLDALRRQVLLRRGGQLRAALDAPDLTRQARQYGRLVSQTRADFEHPLVALEPKRLDHRRHQRRLRRDLPAADLDRPVRARLALPARRHVRRTRNRRQRIQHPLIAHADEPRRADKPMRARVPRHPGRIVLRAAALRHPTRSRTPGLDARHGGVDVPTDAHRRPPGWT